MKELTDEQAKEETERVQKIMGGVTSHSSFTIQTEQKDPTDCVCGCPKSKHSRLFLWKNTLICSACDCEEYKPQGEQDQEDKIEEQRQSLFKARDRMREYGRTKH